MESCGSRSVGDDLVRFHRETDDLVKFGAVRSAMDQLGSVDLEFERFDVVRELDEKNIIGEIHFGTMFGQGPCYK